MDLDRGLLSSVIREKNGFNILQKIPEEMIEGDAVLAYKFIRDYFMQYAKVPGYQLILDHTGIDLLRGINLQEPSGFFVDKIKERFYWHKIREGVHQVVTSLETQAPIADIKSMLGKLLYHDLYDSGGSDTLPRSIFNRSDQLLDDYEKAKRQGVTGVHTPWPSMDRMTMGWQREDFILFVSRPGSGKCHGIDTPILMFDGSIKKVQDVRPGDQLMGPDSRPRNVLSVNTGRENMFRIVPVKGDSWTCNESHILSLKISSTWSKEYKAGDVVNISVRDYLKKNKKFKHQAKLWRSAVDFKESPLFIDPYLVGLWLGDGLRDEAVICNPDIEVIDYLKKYCEVHGYRLNNENSNNEKCPTWRISNSYQGNPVTEFVRERCMTADRQRTIPREYMINSRHKRLRILAGLIDTDGYHGSGHYEIITKFDRLKDDILFLSKSLGFAAYASTKIGRYKDFEGVYWRINISGHISEIPVRIKRKKAAPRKQKKNVLLTGFQVEPLGEGDYYGFTLDGDHLYLLGDFTVTHNTWLLLIILLHAWERGFKVMLFSTEMSVIALKRRVMALLTKLSYSLIKAGRLSEPEFELYKETLKLWESDDRFMVVGNDTTLKRSIIEQNIVLEKPELICIDGYYMVEDDLEKHQKDDRGAIWKVGKKMAKKYQIPIIVSHQLNRKPQGQKPGMKPDLDRLSHSDAAGMYADFVFSIWQTEEMNSDKRLGLLPMKTRDSELKGAMEIRWDLRNGLYNEIEREVTTVETAEVKDYRAPTEPGDIPF